MSLLTSLVQICSHAVGWHLEGVLAQLQLVHLVGTQPDSTLYTREDLQLPYRKRQMISWWRRAPPLISEGPEVSG